MGRGGESSCWWVGKRWRHRLANGTWPPLKSCSRRLWGWCIAVRCSTLKDLWRSELVGWLICIGWRRWVSTGVSRQPSGRALVWHLSALGMFVNSLDQLLAPFQENFYAGGQG